jgi:hypothetical protein
MFSTWLFCFAGFVEFRISSMFALLFHNFLVFNLLVMRNEDF